MAAGLIRPSAASHDADPNGTGVSAAILRADAPMRLHSSAFALSFAVLPILVLFVFCRTTLRLPKPILFIGDSFGYISPGLDLMDSGISAKGQSVRDIGYPLFTWFALRTGSLSSIPALQLFLVTAGLACLVGVLYVALDGMAARLKVMAGLPLWVSGSLGGFVAASFCVAAVCHDRFMLNIYSLMAEAPHLPPMAAALLLLVAGCTAGSPRRRIILLTLATTSAYLSTMIKPHSSMTVMLCAAALVLVAIRNLASVRSVSVISIGMLCLVLCTAAHLFDVWMTPPDNDFGPKTLFCNHLDILLPSLQTSTPERREVSKLAHGVLESPEKWHVLGLDGDLCFYNNAFSAAISAAARSEHLPAAAWQMEEFTRGIENNPIAYGRKVVRQMAYFMAHTVEDITMPQTSSISDWDWNRLQKFPAFLKLPRSALEQDVRNWIPDRYPGLSRTAKSGLQFVKRTFKTVAVASTLLALMTCICLRVWGVPEIALLATAAFTLCFALTTALAHTFDINRYLTGVLPFSLLWWFLGVAYSALAVVSGVLAVAHRHRLGTSAIGGAR